MISDVLLNEGWLISMQEEIAQFKRNDVWDLVPRPSNKIVIGTRWVFRNKLDGNGIITKNKDGIVAKRYIKVEGIDYEETYVLIAHLKAIRLLLTFVCYLDLNYIKWILNHISLEVI